MSTWIPLTEDTLPPEGMVVETQNSSGEVTLLVRKGGLMFFPDFSMYVYYTPQAWRLVPGSAR
jgi:hypothetical protein